MHLILWFFKELVTFLIYVNKHRIKPKKGITIQSNYPAEKLSNFSISVHFQPILPIDLIPFKKCIIINYHYLCHPSPFFITLFFPIGHLEFSKEERDGDPLLRC